MRWKKSHRKGKYPAPTRVYVFISALDTWSSVALCSFLLRTVSPENRRANRSSHNTQGAKRDLLGGAEAMHGLRNNSSNSALRPTPHVGHNSDERVAKRNLLSGSASGLDDDLVDSILNVSIYRDYNFTSLSFDATRPE